MTTSLGEPNASAITGFLIFIALSLGITWWAARKTRSTEHFYAAGRSISGFQNGLALAGDYMSAASFLGIAGLVSTVRFRWPDLLDRLSRRMAGRPLSDCRTAPQPRQVHVHGRGGVAPATRTRARGSRRGLARGRDLLPHRADGRRRQSRAAALRPRLLGGDRDRRRGHARVRPLRGNARDDLGADREGGAADDRRADPRASRAGAFRLQPARAVRRGRGSVRGRRARARDGSSAIRWMRCRSASR